MFQGYNIVIRHLYNLSDHPYKSRTSQMTPGWLIFLKDPVPQHFYSHPYLGPDLFPFDLATACFRHLRRWLMGL